MKIQLDALPNGPIALMVALSPLYCNTVLANLNARAFVKSVGYSESFAPVVVVGLSNSSDAPEIVSDPTTVTRGLENRLHPNA
jgi:hypothetical protein